MNNMNLTKLAKDIIRTNIYLTLATAGETPWAAPVYYRPDDQYNLYFVSQPASLHGQHINRSSQVAFAIFDSHQAEGSGVGVQGLGVATVVEASELSEALRWYSSSFIKLKAELLTGKASYRMYKLKLKKIFVLDPNAATDKRVQVDLQE